MIEPKEIFQIGIIVEDLASALVGYSELLGIKSRNLIEVQGSLESSIRYREKPTPAGCKQAFFDIGGLELELIEPVGSPSTWADALDGPGPGIHHLAIRVDDMEEAVDHFRSLGIEVIQTASFPGGSYVYLDTQGELGAILELLSFSE